jgi:hypothetical protein
VIQQRVSGWSSVGNSKVRTIATSRNSLLYGSRISFAREDAPSITVLLMKRSFRLEVGFPSASDRSLGAEAFDSLAFDRGTEGGWPGRPCATNSQS